MIHLSPHSSGSERSRRTRAAAAIVAVVAVGAAGMTAANALTQKSSNASPSGGFSTLPTLMTLKLATPSSQPATSDPTTTAKPGQAPTTGKPAAAASVQTVAHWESAFLSQWDKEDKSEYRAASSSADSWQFYNLGYAMDATVSMFQATGDTKYLDRALIYANNTINTAKASSSISTSQFKDQYLGWGSKSHPDGQDGGKEYPLYESYFWRYVTNMLVAMKADPKVMANASYKSQYDKVLAFSENNMFNKWMARGQDNIYRSHTHMSSHWAMIAFDLSLTSTNASQVAKYQKVVDKFDADMHKQLSKTAAGGYTWSAPWGSTNAVQDVSHGNAVMAYIAHAHDYGNKKWTDADIKAFVVTFDKTIWPSANKYAQSVDGSGSDNGWFNDGFVDLGRYDAALQKRLEGHKVAQNMQLFASLALNAHLLGRD